MPDPQNRDKPNSGLIHEQPLVETGPFAGKYRCWRRNSNCSNEDCGHKYTKDEYDLWACPECGADRHCRRIVGKKGGACKKHGGASLKGVDSPQFKHGNYSRYWEADLAERYDEFLTDPERLAVEQEMALMRTLLSQELEELSEGGSARQWRRARAAYDNAMKAYRARNFNRMAGQLQELGAVLNEGEDRRAKLAEIRNLTEANRKLVDTQRQIYVDMGEFITRGVILRMINNWLEIIQNEISKLEGGSSALLRIADAIERVVGPIGGGTVAARGGQARLPDGELAD